MTEAIVFGVALVATVLSSMSGGGTGIIMFPAYLSLGLPYPLVLAMSNASSTFWVLPASFNFLKGRAVDWVFIFFFSLIGLVGAYLAIEFVVTINERILSLVVGALIIILVGYVYFHKDFGMTESVHYSRWRQMLAYPFALLLGFYENIFGSGNGIAFTTIARYTKGFTFVDALGHYYAIAFSWCLFGLVLLVLKGYYDLSLMAAVVSGSVIGGYVGSRYARYKGNAFIKTVFVVVGGVLGLKLLLGL